MLNKNLLTTMLKLAVDTEQIKPEEVMAVLQRKAQGQQEDKNTETVDSEILDSAQPSKDDVSNDEGKILETTFKELDVEDAISELKETKKVAPAINSIGPTLLGPTNNQEVQKIGFVLRQPQPTIMLVPRVKLQLTKK